MDNTGKNIIPELLGRNYNYHSIKELSILQYFTLKAVYNLVSLLFHFLFSNFKCQAKISMVPTIQKKKIKKFQTTSYIPRQEQWHSEVCSEHLSLCHWKSCKTYLKWLLSISTSKTHFQFSSTFRFLKQNRWKCLLFVSSSSDSIKLCLNCKEYNTRIVYSITISAERRKSCLLFCRKATWWSYSLTKGIITYKSQRKCWPLFLP